MQLENEKFFAELSAVANRENENSGAGGGPAIACIVALAGLTFYVILRIAAVYF